MGLFSKEQCGFCDNKVGFFSRKRLVNKEGYICKECEKKCSSLINVGRFTKSDIEEHMKYMENQNKIYLEAFEPLTKDQKQRFMCVETGVEFADDIAMFKYNSPADKKKVYNELFRYDQIKSYEPYTVENSNSQGGKKFSEVGVKIKLYCSWTPDMKDKVGNRSYHPYVEELKVPRHKNVDSYTSDPMIDYLDKLFGKYEDNSLVGGIKSSFIGTNKQRQDMKMAADSLKALGSLAKSKITGNEDDIEKANENIESLKNEAADYITGNRATYTKIANEVEDRILK